MSVNRKQFFYEFCNNGMSEKEVKFIFQSTHDFDFTYKKEASEKGFSVTFSLSL